MDSDDLPPAYEEHPQAINLSYTGDTKIPQSPQSVTHDDVHLFTSSQNPPPPQNPYFSMTAQTPPMIPPTLPMTTPPPPISTYHFPSCYLCPKASLYACTRCSKTMCLTHKDHYFVTKTSHEMKDEKNVNGGKPDPFRDIILCTTCRPIVHAEQNKPGFLSKLFFSKHIKCEKCGLQYEKTMSTCPKCFVPVRQELESHRSPPPLDLCFLCPTLATDKCYQCSKLICVPHQHHFMSTFGWGGETLSRDLILCDDCLLLQHKKKGKNDLREGDCRTCGTAGATAFPRCKECGTFTREQKFTEEGPPAFHICYHCPNIARDKCYRCFKLLCPQSRFLFTEIYLSKRGNSENNESDVYRQRIRITCEDCFDYRKVVDEINRIPMNCHECSYCCLGVLLCPAACLGCFCIQTASNLKKRRQNILFKGKRPNDDTPPEFAPSCECCILPCERQTMV